MEVVAIGVADELPNYLDIGVEARAPALLISRLVSWGIVD
ncbi:hypothetical protein MPS_1505 [Mycobacterium pseudoshottsii JCM 15466]|nr:hypothetical protein MPS_1505 [Mycobacterium pseudoshottsii JCM 15466]